MKKAFLVILGLALPALAAASEPTPVPESEPVVIVSQEEGSEAELQSRLPPPQPYCWDLDNTACTSVGSILSCTDGIYTDYVCTCRSYTSGSTTKRIWDCPEVR
ncbi:hypothetical protein JRI60_40920 [Archangium violaceum]|uniref:hypothetical protein n=1 Tax=Archangium violaceum TaxID=83451 RepID=UPI00194DDB14|nr:hypothetical protein [Archangium violaceum]QRN95377.1 hypothetical protein JRI60_40920 [Archangium violaceum]